MLFSSYLFLFCYLPLVLLLYFALPWAANRLSRGRIGEGRLLLFRNVILLAVSLFFYGWGEPIYVLLMVLTVAADYLFGLWVEKSRHPKRVLSGAVLFNLSLLFYFKYAGFFAALAGLSFAAPRMPIGISFYTFQALSYVADVYFGRVRAEKNALTFGTYVALFPQLIAGPIVRYSDVAAELKLRRHTAGACAEGARKFIAGLAKKVLIANGMGALFEGMSAAERVSATGAWLALLGFAFQIYFDFSGYSDMAVGLGRIFGFRFPQNFNYPYIAISFTDFWRRWHITLSSFFREYVYIPLGGSRRGRLRTVLNLFAVWALTGLWHGAAWNFVLWGLYYFFFLTLEKLFLSRPLAHVPPPLRHLLTLLGILFGWLLFAFDGSAPHLTLGALGSFVLSLLGQNGLWPAGGAYELLRHIPFLLIAAIGSTPLPHKVYRYLVGKWCGFSVVFPLLGLLFSVSYLASTAFNPFLYFRF